MEQQIEYKVSYRDIKYPRLEFKAGELLCVLPFGHEQDSLLEKHRVWIDKKSDFIAKCLSDAKNKKLTKRTDEEFKKLVFKYIDSASRELNAGLNGIFFRTMRTKWASLSPKRNLTLNTLMTHLPEQLIEYITFHETAHTIEKRHNEKFWDIIARKFGDHSEMEGDLFAYWFVIADKYGN